jgi:branched-chain amino acid transport system ATP-binding protein
VAEAAAMLEVRSLRKAFSGFVATNDVSLAVAKQQIYAIIGPNGAGKSTLFNLITGHLVPDEGSVVLEGRDITGVAPHKICKMGMARSFQRTNIFPKLTVYENVQASYIAHEGHGLNMWGRSNGYFRDKTDAMIRSLGLDDVHDTIAGELSHGAQKQVELAIALAGEPNILLLDEPTAGMSAQETHESIELLARIAKDHGLTLLFTEHDMDVVFSIAQKISVLHQGRIIATGTPEEVRNNAEVRRVYLGGKH